MSDGITDSYRSERIENYTRKLLDAQKDFLIEPSQEKLEKVYKICDKLAGLPNGYWGETGKFAGKIKEDYKERFGNNKEYNIKLEDIADHLNSLRGEYRVMELVDLITLAQKNNERDREYYNALKKNFQYVNGHLTLSQANELKGKGLTGEKLDAILKDSKIGEIFPIEYQ